MLWEEVGEVDRLVCPPLRNYHHTPDLLHLRVVRGTHSIQVACNLEGREGEGRGLTYSHREYSSPDLCAQVRNDDEFLEDVFREDVCEASFLDVVRRDVDVVGSQVEVGGRDGSNSPLRCRRERLPLIVAGCRDDYLIAVFVGGAGGGCRQLGLLLRLFLNLGNLLPLLGGGRDLHSQDDVPDLRLCQRRHIHTVDTHSHWRHCRTRVNHSLVLLAIVCQNEVFECDLYSDPLFVRQSGPNMVWLCDGRLVWLQDDLCPVSVDVEGPQNQHESREGLQHTSLVDRQQIWV